MYGDSGVSLSLAGMDGPEGRRGCPCFCCCGPRLSCCQCCCLVLLVIILVAAAAAGGGYAYVRKNLMTGEASSEDAEEWEAKLGQDLNLAGVGVGVGESEGGDGVGILPERDIAGR